MSSALPAADLAATWSAAGQGEQLWFLGTLAIIRVPGDAVDDRFAVIEFVIPRGGSPPFHTHPQDESYIVLDGQLTVQAGADRFQLAPGGIAVVPAGVAHTFLVESDIDPCAGAEHTGRTRAIGPRRLRARDVGHAATGEHAQTNP